MDGYVYTYILATIVDTLTVTIIIRIARPLNVYTGNVTVYTGNSTDDSEIRKLILLSF